MSNRLIRTIVICVLLVLLALAVQAQQTQTYPPGEAATRPTVEQLQRQIEELTRQLLDVQRQLDEIQDDQEAQHRQAELDALRQAAAAEAAREEASDEVDTATEFASGTRMQPQLNPEISVTGDIFFVAGDHLRTEVQPRHFELDLQAYLDPYTKMRVVFGYEGAHSEWGFHDPGHDEHEHGPGGFALGEGYVTWLQLGGNSSLTVGKKRAQFGTLNRWHMHALPQTDSPWVLVESFGNHGLSGTGVAVNWLMPRLWADTNELTVEVTNGDNEIAFAGSDWSKPSVLAFLKSYWDLSANSYLELDLTGLHGVTDEAGDLDHDFLALDLVYDWYPAGRELYRGFELRGMLLRSWLELEDGGGLDTWGSYLYGQYRFATSWVAGLRWDRVEDQREAGREYWGLSPYLTFWQSEFVRLRGQYSFRDDNRHGVDQRFELQLTFAAGPHKHETY